MVEQSHGLAAGAALLVDNTPKNIVETQLVFQQHFQ